MPCKYVLCCCWKRNRTRSVQDNSQRDRNLNPDHLFIISGNPRNKYALKLGHSLMDWIRLGNSGKDLTGIGKQSGKLKVSKKQLAEHCTNDDIWISMNGKVYNVTAYMEFHPGGPNQLMKAAGKDATKLFNETHPWVNYETILQKCLIGPLQNECNENENMEKEIESFKKLLQNNKNESESIESDAVSVVNIPRFDWIQKSSTLTLYFYTKSDSNPMVLIEKLQNKRFTNIFIISESYRYTNTLEFSFNIEKLLQIFVNFETGRIEICFKKEQPAIWPNFGELHQFAHKITASELSSSNTSIDNQFNNDFKHIFILENVYQVNHNTFLLSFYETLFDGFFVPIGCHFNFQAIIKGAKITRSYTPIPCQFVTKHSDNKNNCMHLLVKSYKKGAMSSFVCNQKSGFQFEAPIVRIPFQLRALNDFHDFLLIAAGTGITPMLSLLCFLLNRRIQKPNKIEFIFFNCTEKDILLKNELEKLVKIDSRLKICYILSEPGDSWNGPKGKINIDILRINLKKFIDLHSVFCTICGPDVFANLTKAFLLQLHLNENQIYCFL